MGLWGSEWLSGAVSGFVVQDELDEQLIGEEMQRRALKKCQVLLLLLLLLFWWI